MKKIFRSIAALAVVMFAGCTNDLTNEVVVPVGGKTTVEIGIDDSRTYLGDLVDGTRKVYWANGDKVTINGVASTAVELNEAKTHATFEFDQELTYPYSIFYPAEMYKDAATITLPASQGAATGSFANDTAPMAVYAVEGEALSLKHLAAVVRLQLTLPAESAHSGHKINKVEFRGNNGEQVSGDFAIDYAAVELTPASTAEADKVVSTSVSKYLSAEATTDVFVVVPAQQYANGFTVRIIDEAGHYMDMKAGAKTLEKGQIVAMPAVEFVPTGTIIGVEIKSAADLVAFAKDYNAGVYYGIHPFIVHITDDIVFDDTTNAAWEAIGCTFAEGSDLHLQTGGTTNYWHGYLEGNNHTIKNWVTSRPLFAYTGSGSMVKDLTVDASCTLTANYALTKNSYFGPLVNYHRGNLVNCHNYANITITGAWDTGGYVGGVVGRTVVGSVRECTNHGTITIAADYAADQKTLHVAGIVGYISNPDGEVLNCTNYGKIIAEDGAKISEPDTDWDAYVYMGGIVGKAEGNIEDCVNMAEATITTKMEAACHQVGGIVGCSENAKAFVNRCTNYATINFETLPTRSSDQDGRYGYVGGIAGQTVNDINDCANYGSIYSTTSLKMHYVGGIVGLVSKDSGVEHVEFKNNINGKDVVIQATGGARVLYIGGLIGENNCSTTIVDLTNDNGSILGTIKGGNVESSTSYGTASFGGYVGATIQAMTIKGTTEGANIELDYTAAKNALRHCHGGVIGSSTVAGLVVENAESNNYIKVTTAGVVLKYVETGMGGILGYALKGGVTITNSTSNCPITWNKGNSKSNGYPCYTGGIVGYVVEGDATITNCHNKVELQNWFYNNNGYRSTADAKPCNTAGIIGGFGWLSENAGTLTVTNCSNTGKLYAQRGCVGGITGSVCNATITGCTFTEGSIYNAQGNANLQGVVGGISAAVENSSITDCTVKADILGGTNGSVVYRAGGIAAVVEGTSTINNCSYFGSIAHYNADASKIDYYGGIAGMAVNTTSITNCRYGGSIWGVAINSGNYESYIANVVTNNGTEYDATVEDCYYWDGK